MSIDISFKSYSHLDAAEMIQLVKGSPCKYEDLSFMHQTPLKTKEKEQLKNRVRGRCSQSQNWGGKNRKML